MEIKVTICAPEICRALEGLTRALSGQIAPAAGSEPVADHPVPVTDYTEEPAEAPAEEPKKEEAPAKKPAKKPGRKGKTAVASEPVAVPLAGPAAPAEPEKTYSLEEVGRIGAAVVDKVGVAPVMDLVRDKYGVVSIQKLPPEKYGEFVKDLEALSASHTEA